MRRPTHTFISAAGVLMLLIIGLSEGTAAQKPATSFRARADLVKVDVSVLQRGRPVAGLTADDFELRDNGVVQSIAALDHEQLPIDLTMALDVSGSVHGLAVDQLRRAIGDLRRDLRPIDRLRLLTFNARITRVVDFGEPASAIDAAFQNVRPSGGSAVLDTIAVTLTTRPLLDRRQLAVIFSDGADQGSITTPEQLLDIARHTTPTLGIVLVDPSIGAARQLPAVVSRHEMYARLASETGGFLETLAGGQSLAATFRRILTNFRMS